MRGELAYATGCLDNLDGILFYLYKIKLHFGRWNVFDNKHMINQFHNRHIKLSIKFYGRNIGL